jgi:NADH:ubiquinone oxidoreductase subunit 4 (subunit M)
MPFLSFLLLFPLVGALVIACIPSWKVRAIKTIALCTSLINFIVACGLWLVFDNSTAKFQFVEHIGWLPFFNMNAYIGIDGISLFFIVLTTFLVPVCLLVGWVNISKHIKEYCLAFLVLETCMLAVFCMLDLLLFYVFFESVLLPMFLIIGVWGSRARKIRAAYQFFLYTLIGSVLMLLAILLIYFQVGTTDLQVLLVSEFSERRQLLLWPS